MNKGWGRIFLMVACLGAGLVLANSAEWKTNYERALEQAKKENKKVLLNFTGSDWCGWCKKLEEDVFSRSEFEKYAEANLVMVELDFPRTRMQSDDLKKQNQELKAKYGTSGFPNTIILNSDGKEIGRIDGYMEGGPAAYIKAIENMK